MTATPRRCITVLYPNKPGVTFGFDYYLKHHATLTILGCAAGKL